MRRNKDSLLLLAFGSWLIILGTALSGCNQKDPKFQQYLVEGEQLYMAHCSNCHQKNGTGLGLVYPPLAASDYMDTNFDKVFCIIKNGTEGEMTVNGKVFNKPMKGVTSLTELEIAEIANYIYNSWGHEKGFIDIKTAHASLESCLDN